MLDTLLLLLGLLSFVLPWILTLVLRPAGVTLLWLALGAVVGLVGMPMLGTFWLDILFPENLDSQGGGIAYLVVFLPLFALLGLLTGVWAIAFGHYFWRTSTELTQPLIVGLVVSVPLGSVLLWLMMAVLGALLETTMQHNNVRFVAVMALSTSVLSAWLGQWITRWIGQRGLW